MTQTAVSPELTPAWVTALQLWPGLSFPEEPSLLRLTQPAAPVCSQRACRGRSGQASALGPHRGREVTHLRPPVCASCCQASISEAD